jgi:hypothetical protein
MRTDRRANMITALIPQLLPLISGVIDKTIPDENGKAKALQDIEKTLIENASSINLAQIATNQTEAKHKNIFVAGWRPAIGWSCALGIFWLFIGANFAQWGMNMAGVEGEVPTVPSDVLLELTFAMLGMAGLRTFEKIKGVSK